MTLSKWAYPLFVLFGFALPVFPYKPVIVIHGLMQDGSNVESLKFMIQAAHPGTEVHVVDIFDNYASFQPMWKQVEGMKSLILPIMKAAADGVHIIGYSQGGLAARGIVQTTDEHNVNSFISLSSPLNGQYGETYYLDAILPTWSKGDLYEFFYSFEGQRWSVGNYWKDPHQLSFYQQYSVFLAQLNNETGAYPSDFRMTWRTNFERLKKLVLVGGPSDEVISPWQSAQFGFYDDKESVVPMKSQEMYSKNSFGLKTLDRRNALVLCTIPGVFHLNWPSNSTVFDKCIAPHLD